MSTLLRIMTNYFQTISLSLSFKLNYPNYLLSAFTPMALIGQVASTFLSFDCLFKGLVSNHYHYRFIQWLCSISLVLQGYPGILHTTSVFSLLVRGLEVEILPKWKLSGPKNKPCVISCGCVVHGVSIIDHNILWSVQLLWIRTWTIMAHQRSTVEMLGIRSSLLGSHNWHTIIFALDNWHPIRGF